MHCSAEPDVIDVSLSTVYPYLHNMQPPVGTNNITTSSCAFRVVHPLDRVVISIVNMKQWALLHRLTNEMIVTRTGRSVFTSHVNICILLAYIHFINLIILTPYSYRCLQAYIRKLGSLKHEKSLTQKTLSR